MNHSFSDTNCIDSSTDHGDKNTVTSSKSNVSIPSVTNDMDAHSDSSGLIAAVAVTFMVLLVLGVIIGLVLIMLRVKKRYNCGIM